MLSVGNISRLTPLRSSCCSRCLSLLLSRSEHSPKCVCPFVMSFLQIDSHPSFGCGKLSPDEQASKPALPRHYETARAKPDWLQNCGGCPAVDTSLPKAKRLMPMKQCLSGRSSKVSAGFWRLTQCSTYKATAVCHPTHSDKRLIRLFPSSLLAV